MLGAGAATVICGLHRSGRLKSGPLGLEVSSRQHDRPQKIPGTSARLLAPNQDEYLAEFGWSEADIKQMRVDHAKMGAPDRPAAGDVFLNRRFRRALPSTLARLHRAEEYFGHGFFNIVGFGQLFKEAANIPKIGGFGIDEIGLLQWLFFEDAASFGFRGPRVTTDFLEGFRASEMHYEKRFGQYLFTHRAKPLWDRMRSDIGEDLILTSGVRGLPKQSRLFLDKLMAQQANVSLVSRSLAPPGYSFHGVGDFDVGSRRLGAENFTHAFVYSQVFRRMQTLNYVELRYPDNNRLGVRYEPWHVKVAPG